MNRNSIWRFVATLLRVLLAFGFGYVTFYIFLANSLFLSLAQLQHMTTTTYLYGACLLGGIVSVAVDSFLHRTRAVFLTGLVAIIIYAAHLIFLPWFIIGLYQHQQKSYGFLGPIFVVGLYLILVWPLLASLVFGGGKSGGQYTAMMCGIAAWTGICCETWRFRWETLNVYSIGIYLVGALVAAFLGKWGGQLRVVAEEYFAARQEERQWRKVVRQRWEA